MNQIYIGMDLHKNTSSFSVKDKDGQVIDQCKVPTEPSAIKGYLQYQNSSLAVEPVSRWYFYSDLIQNLGIDVHLANPLKVKSIASARIRTDKIDACVLCDLLRSNLLLEAYFASPYARYWKEMVRYRSSLIHLRTQIKNKIHNILFRNGLWHGFTNLFGVGGRKWLGSLSLAEHFAFTLWKSLWKSDLYR